MGQLSDAIASANTAADSAISRVQNDVANLRQQVSDLQAQVDSGNASPADIQALADLQAKLDGLDPSTPAVLPPTP